MASDEVERRIVELRAFGLSYRAVAAHLNRKGYPPARAAAWSAMTVRNIAVRAERRAQGGR